jgi:hypothetical protein
VDEEEEAVWAVAEAWVQAEAQAEELAWRAMEREMASNEGEDFELMQIQNSESENESYKDYQNSRFSPTHDVPNSKLLSIEGGDIYCKF